MLLLDRNLRKLKTNIYHLDNLSNYDHSLTGMSCFVRQDRLVRHTFPRRARRAIRLGSEIIFPNHVVLLLQTVSPLTRASFTLLNVYFTYFRLTQITPRAEFAP